MWLWAVLDVCAILYVHMEINSVFLFVVKGDENKFKISLMKSKGL